MNAAYEERMGAWLADESIPDEVKRQLRAQMEFEKKRRQPSEWDEYEQREHEERAARVAAAHRRRLPGTHGAETRGDAIAR